MVEMLKLPDWMASLTPFGHVPKIPVEEVNVLKLAVLTLTASALTAAGFAGYKRRDVQG
jgi:ABC-2 type transport system permease protein